MRSRKLVLWCGMLATLGVAWGCGDDAGNGGDQSSGSGAVSGSAGRSGSSSAGRSGSGSAGRSGSGGAGRSGSGGGGAMLPASLPEDRPLSELGAGDAAALCAALDAELSAAVTNEDAERLSCTLLALLTSVMIDGSGQGMVDQARCEAAVTDCLNGGLGEPMTESMCDEAGLAAAAEGCSTTVGEFFECLHASGEQLAMAVDTITCEALADPEILQRALGNPMDPAMTPECAAVQAECPALLAGSGASGPPAADGCDDTCSDADDGFCDDGGPGSDTNFCALGTDCTDCGPR